MSKYIVKDCPCLDSDNITCQDCTQDNLGIEACINRNNCVMKQIVEKCKNTQFLSTKNRQDLYAVKVFANDILQLLDIQEVE